MARTKTVEELQAEQERIENELKIKTQKLKALKQQQQEQLRKERTHRLCTHGAMLEQYLPSERKRSLLKNTRTSLMHGNSQTDIYERICRIRTTTAKR